MSFFHWYVRHPYSAIEGLVPTLRQLPQYVRDGSIKKKNNDEQTFRLANAALKQASQRSDIPAEWSVLSTVATRSGGAVLRVGSSDSSREAMLKLAPIAEWNDNHTNVINELRHTHGLSLVTALLPKELSNGIVEETRYAIESWIEGETIDARDFTPSDRRQVIHNSLDIINQLHSATGALTRVDDALLNARFSKPFATLRNVWVNYGKSESDVELVRNWFFRELRDRELWISRIHGDFHLSNVLIGTDNQLVGIIDWDRSQMTMPSYIDITYLLFAEWKRQIGAPFGYAVRELLRDQPLPPEIHVHLLRKLDALSGDVPDFPFMCITVWLLNIYQNAKNSLYFSHFVWFHTMVEIVMDELVRKAKQAQCKAN